MLNRAVVSMYPPKQNDDLLSQHVLGHLLGVLDDDEQAVVETRLEQDPEYVRELSRWRRQLAALEALRRDYEPSPGLANRTCQLVSERRTALSRWIGMSPVPCPPSWIGRVGLLDVSVVVLLFVAAAVLLLPAICNSRFHARMLWCQDGLRQFGASLTQCGQPSGPSPVRMADGEAFVPTGVVVCGRRGNDLLLLEDPFQAVRFVPAGSRQSESSATRLQTVTLPVSSSRDDWLASRRVAYVSSPTWFISSNALNTWASTPIGWADRRVESASGSSSSVLSPLDRLSSQGVVEDSTGPSRIGGSNLLFDDGHAAFFACSSERDLADAMSSEDVASSLARIFAPSTSPRR